MHPPRQSRRGSTARRLRSNASPSRRSTSQAEAARRKAPRTEAPARAAPASKSSFKWRDFCWRHSLDVWQHGELHLRKHSQRGGEQAPMGQDQGRRQKPPLSESKKPALLHGSPAVFGAADASERASEMFLRTGAFFSSILSELLKNLVALQTCRRK